ncbi:MAG: stage II sporulation protein M [Gammaproteobacteria bacterium]|nr:stage II sporulation protein M [Gammaproteobacteria bacterium]
MNQAQFIAQHEQQWLILEALIRPMLIQPNDFFQEKIRALEPKLIQDADFSSLYRKVCQHLSLAQSRYYSPYLIKRLSLLVEQAHQVFYNFEQTYAKNNVFNAVWIFFSQTFPQTVRNEIKWLWLSSLFFFLPLFFMIFIIQIWPEFVFRIINPTIVQSIEEMYDPQLTHIGREREAGSDIMMFGFYIFNNTSIGFRTFATGLFLGVGSIFTLLFNGLYIGAIAGHLTSIGYSSTFWSFVSGHSAIELTAIALSGAAGLKMGFSLLIPGRKSRYQSLLDAAKISVKIMVGAMFMFFIAAFIEAFWSSSKMIPIYIKYIVGISLWILMCLYFISVGHTRNKASNET